MEASPAPAPAPPPPQSIMVKRCSTWPHIHINKYATKKGGKKPWRGSPNAPMWHSHCMVIFRFAFSVIYRGSKLVVGWSWTPLDHNRFEKKNKIKKKKKISFIIPHPIVHPLSLFLLLTPLGWYLWRVQHKVWCLKSAPTCKWFTNIRSQSMMKRIINSHNSAWFGHLKTKESNLAAFHTIIQSIQNSTVLEPLILYL